MATRASRILHFTWKSSWNDHRNAIHSSRDARSRQLADAMMWRPKVMTALLRHQFPTSPVLKTLIRGSKGRLLANDYASYQAAAPEGKPATWSSKMRHLPWLNDSGRRYERKRAPRVRETPVAPLGRTEVDRAVARVFKTTQRWPLVEVSPLASLAADPLLRVEYTDKSVLQWPPHAGVAESDVAAVRETLERLGATGPLSMEKRPLLLLLEAYARSRLLVPVLHAALIVGVTEHLHALDGHELNIALKRLVECATTRRVTLAGGGVTLAAVVDDIAATTPLLAPKLFGGGLLRVVGHLRRRQRMEEALDALYLSFGLAGWSLHRGGGGGDATVPLENPSVPQSHPSAPLAFLMYTLRLDVDQVSALRAEGWAGDCSAARMAKRLLSLARWLEVLADVCDPVLQDAAAGGAATRTRLLLLPSSSTDEAGDIAVARREADLAILRRNRAHELVAAIMQLAADIVAAARERSSQGIADVAAATARLLGALEWHLLTWDADTTRVLVLQAVGLLTAVAPVVPHDVASAVYRSLLAAQSQFAASKELLDAIEPFAAVVHRGLTAAANEHA